MNRYIFSIRIRQLFSRLMGWVGSVKKEIAFVEKKNFKLAELKKIEYEADQFEIAGMKFRFLTLFGKPIWYADWQFDSRKLWERGKGDCNSIHRLYQVWWSISGLKSYLVNIYGSKSGHAVNIFIKGSEYALCDYGKVYFFPTYSDCIRKVEKMYSGLGEIKGIVIQDINWKVVNRI